MRKKSGVLAGILIIGLCAGCGQREYAAQEQETVGVLDEAGGSDEAEAGDAEAVGEDVDAHGGNDAADAVSGQTVPMQESGETAPPAEEEEPDGTGLDIPENGRRLTAEELEEYTEWVQDNSNYGFLLSDWENPTQIDLYQVFYSGAGVARQGTEEEKQAFLERHDQQEIYTDFIAIDKADVDALLVEKTGLTYDELVMKGSKGMEDWYYAETDSFCSESGDTNYCQFVCTDGVINEEGTMVTLQCDGDDWVRTCEVEVIIISEPWGIVGNHITEGMVLDRLEPSEAADAIQEGTGRLIEESVFENLRMDADASAVENTYVLGDWSRITKEALQGIWYYHPKDVGESKEYDVVLQFDGDRAVVYYPAVGFYGDAYYEWDIVDRSDRRLCPELAIYWRGTKEGELAWYILGLSEENDYFWCNGEVFYRQ